MSAQGRDLWKKEHRQVGWLGKILGGTIGFAIGGPLGAIAGAAFGHAFDRSSQDALTGDGPRRLPQEQAQLTFFVATFSMLAKLANVDGRISSKEIDVINRFMLHDLHLDPQSRMVATNIFNAAINSPNQFEDFANQFYAEFHNQPQLLQMMIDILLRVATADERMSASEETLIRAAANIFNISPAMFENLRSRYGQPSDHHYAVLGCSRNDSDDAIKKKYRRLVMEYHPDRIVSKGLPEEFSKFAQEKFREIQQAYDAIKKERGIK
jgi:DnaJ like chaperone protein